jgi:nitrous oxidase accessory protein NosD
VVAATGAVGVGIMIERSSIVNNLANGLRTIGAGTIRVGSSTIAGNGTATSGAGVLSYGNNQINANGVDTIPGGVPGGLH